MNNKEPDAQKKAMKAYRKKLKCYNVQLNPGVPTEKIIIEHLAKLPNGEKMHFVKSALLEKIERSKKMRKFELVGYKGAYYNYPHWVACVAIDGFDELAEFAVVYQETHVDGIQWAYFPQSEKFNLTKGEFQAIEDYLTKWSEHNDPKDLPWIDEAEDE